MKEPAAVHPYRWRVEGKEGQIRDINLSPVPVCVLTLPLAVGKGNCGPPILQESETIRGRVVNIYIYIEAVWMIDIYIEAEWMVGIYMKT